MRSRFLDLCARLALSAPRRTLGAGLLVTIIAAAFASRLTFNFQWTEMMPADSPLVIGVERVHSEFATGNSYIVAITASERGALEAAGATEATHMVLLVSEECEERVHSLEK